MNKSSCVKCGEGDFEVVMEERKDDAFPIWYIRCAACGGVVGAFYDPQRLVDNIESKIKSLHS